MNLKWLPFINEYEDTTDLILITKHWNSHKVKYFPF